jgi:O-antigen/teichoic acid export membrane protein
LIRAETKTSSLRSGIILSLSSRVYAVGLALIFVPIYIRFLGIEAYGLYGLLSSYLVASAALLDLGFSSTLAHGLAQARAAGRPGDWMRDLVRSIELPACILIAVTLAAFLLTVPWIVEHWRIESSLPARVVVHAVMLIGITVMLQLLLSLYVGGLSGLERQGLLNAILIVGVSLRYVGAAVVVWSVDNAIDTFLAWQALTTALQVVALITALRACLPHATRRPRFRADMLRALCRFTAGMGGITIVGAFMQQSDKLILGALLPLDVFAHYAIATVVAVNIPAVSFTVFNATFARMSHLFARGDASAIADVFHKSSQIVAALILPATTVIAVFPAEIIFVWLGDRLLAAEVAEILRVLVISAALSGLTLTPYILILSAGRSGVVFRIYLLAAIALVLSTYWLTSMFGVVGGAAANVLSYTGPFVALALASVRRLISGELRSWITRDLALPQAIAGAVALLARGLMPEIAPRPTLFVALGVVWLLATTACALAMPWLRQWLWERFPVRTRYTTFGGR